MAGGMEALILDTVKKGVMKIADFNRFWLKSDKPNPFLLGIHTPLTSEHMLSDLEVTGTIPAELHGRYIRIGPNPITPPNPGLYHWFMGDGMLHGVRIQDGKALWYRNRWIRSTAVTGALGEPASPGPHITPFDVVNTNVIGFAGQTWALVEGGGCPVRIDEELNTIAYDPFSGTLTGGSFSAHPHLDPKTGELHAICYSAENLTEIRHVVVDVAGRVRREERITVQDGPPIHDSMISEKYVIVFDLPVTFSLKALMGGHGFPYRWNPKHKPRVGLLAKDGRGGEIIWCDSDLCYVFHPCNAFDNEDGTVMLDVCVYDSVFDGANHGPEAASITFERWCIDPAMHRVSRSVIDSAPQEFPRINETRTSLPYRYAYTLVLPKNDEPSDLEHGRLLKHDLEAGTRQIHDFGVGRVAGEFAFVPAAGGSAEDHGWLMGYVLDTAAATTELVILDARNIAGAPAAVIHIPTRIPPGFHGNWVPDLICPA